MEYTYTNSMTIMGNKIDLTIRENPKKKKNISKLTRANFLRNQTFQRHAKQTNEK